MRTEKNVVKEEKIRRGEKKEERKKESRKKMKRENSRRWIPPAPPKSIVRGEISPTSRSITFRVRFRARAVARHGRSNLTSRRPVLLFPLSRVLLTETERKKNGVRVFPIGRSRSANASAPLLHNSAKVSVRPAGRRRPRVRPKSIARQSTKLFAGRRIVPGVAVCREKTSR